MPTYTMNVFMLPKILCKEINVLLARFWWNSKKEGNGVHWATWEGWDFGIYRCSIGPCYLSKDEKFYRNQIHLSAGFLRRNISRIEVSGKQS